MAEYKTTDFIIGIVRGLLGSLTVPKYLITSPADLSSTVKEYIVINALPVNADVMQKCYVNVNYHVKDIGTGKPDSAKIQVGSNLVLSILKRVTATIFLIDFESQETIPEEGRGEHYSNLRFSFKYVNNPAMEEALAWDVDSLNVDIDDDRLDIDYS